MIEKITQIFKVKELRNKILFILALLVVFRIAANIPSPFFSPEILNFNSFFLPQEKVSGVRFRVSEKK